MIVPPILFLLLDRLLVLHQIYSVNRWHFLLLRLLRTTIFPRLNPILIHQFFLGVHIFLNRIVFFLHDSIYELIHVESIRNFLLISSHALLDIFDRPRLIIQQI